MLEGEMFKILAIQGTHWGFLENSSQLSVKLRASYLVPQQSRGYLLQRNENSVHTKSYTQTVAALPTLSHTRGALCGCPTLLLGNKKE